MFKKLFGKKSQPVPKRPELPTDFEMLQEMAVNHTQALMAAHSQSWGLGQALHWDVDLAAGTIMWVLADGKIARAPAQLIATWSSSENSFLWGWDHPSAPEGTAVAASALKRHAEAHDIAQLIERKVECSMDDGWQLAAMAVLAGDLQGVYRGQASETALGLYWLWQSHTLEKLVSHSCPDSRLRMPFLWAGCGEVTQDSRIYLACNDGFRHYMWC